MIMQGLFQLDAGGERPDPSWLAALQDAGANDSSADRAGALVDQIWAARTSLDELIQAVAHHWDVSRLAATDRAILRLASHELLNPGEASDAVVINEAIELAKAFGTTESPAFVHGILDAIRRRRDARRTGDGAAPAG
jgi:N utilization substance protein B